MVKSLLSDAWKRLRYGRRRTLKQAEAEVVYTYITNMKVMFHDLQLVQVTELRSKRCWVVLHFADGSQYATITQWPPSPQDYPSRRIR